MARRPSRRSAKRQDTAWDASYLRTAWERANPVVGDVARELGVEPETLRLWRHGRFEPTGTQLRKIARMLGVDLLDVLPPE